MHALSQHTGKLCCSARQPLRRCLNDIQIYRSAENLRRRICWILLTIIQSLCYSVGLCTHTHTHSSEVRIRRYGSKTDLNLAKKSLRGEDTFPAVSSSPSNRLHNTFCTKFAKHAHISHGHSTRDPFRYAHIRIQILWQQLMRHFSPHSIHSSLSRHPSVR